MYAERNAAIVQATTSLEEQARKEYEEWMRGKELEERQQHREESIRRRESVREQVQQREDRQRRVELETQR